MLPAMYSIRSQLFISIESNEQEDNLSTGNLQNTQSAPYYNRVDHPSGMERSTFGVGEPDFCSFPNNYAIEK